MADTAQTPTQTPSVAPLDETLAALIYDGGDEAEWLSTVDGSPNVASYEYLHRLIDVDRLDQSPMDLVRAMLKGHDGMNVAEATCMGCRAPLDRSPGSDWPVLAAALHRHQWAVLGLFQTNPQTPDSTDAKEAKEGRQ